MNQDSFALPFCELLFFLMTRRLPIILNDLAKILGTLPLRLLNDKSRKVPSLREQSGKVSAVELVHAVNEILSAAGINMDAEMQALLQKTVDLQENHIEMFFCSIKGSLSCSMNESIFSIIISRINFELQILQQGSFQHSRMDTRAKLASDALMIHDVLSTWPHEHLVS
ncbi:hypothetical protein KIW84_046306 [Lathyrus oleraceus]|uniref:Uncharacterized protein n=1 Tax=Pisum sativum TaxID=3888 RepID=A0A9D4XR76_PEA|nr:hypothetical protein KIW84_046304 [Pisum sativum]KAI5423256.1 hypothetical protein KIW84_046306 [Pisum sativum]